MHFLLLLLYPIYQFQLTYQSTESLSRAPSYLEKKIGVFFKTRCEEELPLLTKKFSEAQKSDSTHFPQIREPEKAQTGSEALLPEVLADLEGVEFFPKPISRPKTVSWFELATLIEKQTVALEKYGLKKDKSEWPEIVQRQNEIFTHYHSQKTWDSLLKEKPLVFEERALDRRKEAEEWVNPHGKKIKLAIATRIQDKKFLNEFRYAVAHHWNDSEWAHSRGLTFQVEFKKENSTALTLTERLRALPKNEVLLTLGGKSTLVVGRVMVLGPERITHRTLAHEFGHLLGYPDCYRRSSSKLFLFGYGISEWDNPYLPDELMCDDRVGVVRALNWP